MKIIYRLPLFDSRTLTQRSFLSNIVMTSYDDYFVVILQFNLSNKGLKKKKTIIYFFKTVQSRDERGVRSIEFLFFIAKEHFEIIISCDLHQLIGDLPEIGIYSSQGDYFFLVLGMTVGLMRPLLINLDDKSMIELPAGKQSESSRLISSRRTRRICGPTECR
jgi:hypothetical protein